MRNDDHLLILLIQDFFLAETTTDMPIFNQRDIILDNFDAEMVRKINLLNY